MTTAVRVIACVGAFVACGAFGAVAAAQPQVLTIPDDHAEPDVAAAASPADVALGARFTVFVTTVFPPGMTVNLREPLDLGPGFEATRRVAVDSVRPDGEVQREWHIEAYAWDLGDVQLPPIAVTFVWRGHAGQVLTNAVPLRVTGVLGDTDDPKLLRPYADGVALVQRTWLWRYVHDPLALGATAAALALGIVLRRWPRKRVAEPPAQPLPIHRPLDMTSDRALERLAEIAQSGALEQNDRRKLGYADMADVVREYVGVRFAIATARELTSGELVGALDRVASAADRDRVAAWLARCDPVKYGGELATADTANAVLEAARALVVATQPSGAPA